MPFVVMIGGPNGSGKTTLLKKFREGNLDLGQYINPDDIAAKLAGDYESRVRKAQVLADELRSKYLFSKTSFTFETVMSHVSKVEFLQKCRDEGFETVLYYVGTIDPRLNVARVAQRVSLGGHDVPVDRIIDRYKRSLELLRPALIVAHRAAIFDNSDYQGLRLGITKVTTGGIPRYTLSADAPLWIKQVARDLEGEQITSMLGKSLYFEIDHDLIVPTFLRRLTN